MAVVTMRQLLDAGVHFGHQTRRWNPKMKRFIFGERGGIYILDLNQTLERIETAYGFTRDLVANGGSVLFETISKRVSKMLEYERMRASGEFEAMPKKEALLLTRELEKLQKNLGGMRDMKSLPAAVFVLDTKKEHIGVTEANKLGIPVIAVVDTNVDPDVVTFPIPGNDDAIRSTSLMCHVIAEAILEGRYIASKRNPAAAPKRSDEDEAAFAQAQADARRQAAEAQAERDARLATAKTTPADAAEAAESTES